MSDKNESSSHRFTRSGQNSQNAASKFPILDFMRQNQRLNLKRKSKNDYEGVEDGSGVGRI